jgi:uridine kinase
MKVALLISGYLRSLKTNVSIIRKNIIEKFDQVDVYLHLTNNEEEDKYLNIVNKKEVDELIHILNPICVIQEDNFHLFEDHQKNSLFNTWIKYYKLNKIKTLNEEALGRYDLVVKYRPDMNLSSNNIFDRIFEEKKIYIPKKTLIDKSKLLKKDDEYVCDIFAFGDTESMNDYFCVYEKLDQLTRDHGSVPETVLYHHLQQQKIPYELIEVDYTMILSMCNVFAICGDSGSGKSTLAKILKTHFSSSFTLECDRYHKWERGDENWKIMTHLNPNANYIAKMEDDIFNLKTRNQVFQVDYDHKTGRFTEKEKINPSSSDNIIVCGLHSLFHRDDSVYDVKIFMDTDEKLKKFWKVRRDVEERGYTIEDSLKQIERREEDYNRYIVPQREKCDIIVRFFVDDEVAIEYDDNQPKMKLSLLINKKFSLEEPIETLYKNEINFSLDSSSEKFNKFTFYQYKKLNEKNKYNLSLGNYYDYVILFILSLRGIKKK